MNETTPLKSQLYNEVAWLLATTQAPARPDPALAVLAVALAKKAVESEPQSGPYYNTLGVARYRAQEWRPAISDLEKSIQLSKGGVSEDFFFLAMAHWRLGEKDLAQKWYDQAVAWMDKKRPNLRQFRAEAAELLGTGK